MTFRVPSRLAYVVEQRDGGDTSVYLLHLPDGEPLSLRGSAALIWLLAADGEPDVPAAVAASVEHPDAEVEAATRAYLAYLVGAGLLEEMP